MDSYKEVSGAKYTDHHLTEWLEKGKYAFSKKHALAHTKSMRFYYKEYPPPKTKKVHLNSTEISYQGLMQVKFWEIL